MKKIYFVRHGATEGNESDEFQHGTISLSEMGLTQAEFVAKRFATIPVDIIIASDMTRASQTGNIIAKSLSKEIRHNALFQEISRPSEVLGKKKNDPGVAKIMEEVRVNFGNQDYHYSDEENFFDAQARALRCLEYLKSVEEDNVLVVTHGRFLIMLIATMTLGDTLTAHQFKFLSQSFVAKNTGITMVDEHKGQYFLLTWNDHTHLGDVDIKFIYN